jgi:myo-inositol-1(or 4)-monophosphatase
LPMLKQTLIEAAQAGGAELKRFFNKQFKISHKEGVNNLVTEADHAAEAAILAIIKKNFPDHQILAEETGQHIGNSDYKWIIDPIDGTVNFAHNIPLCCVAIAIEKEGEIIMSSVYVPVLHELCGKRPGCFFE